MSQNRDVLQRADGRDGRASACRSRACTPRPGPGVYEAAILFGDALEAADRAVLFKTGAKEIGAALRHHAELHGQVERAATRAAAATSTRACRTARRNLFYDAKRPAHDERSCSRATSPGRSRCLMELAAVVLAHRQQLQAPGRRLLGAGQADLGRRQPHRELSRDPRQRRSRRGSRRAARAPTSTRTSPWRPCSPPACYGIEKGLKLDRAADHRQRNQGARTCRALPRTLQRGDARSRANRKIARELLGDDVRRPLRRHARLGMAPVARTAVTDWELKRYFEII